MENEYLIIKYNMNEHLQKCLNKGLCPKLSINNQNIFNDKSNIKQQHTNSQEYITSLLPYAIYHGCVFVYKPCCLKYIGSRGFWCI